MTDNGVHLIYLSFIYLLRSQVSILQLYDEERYSETRTTDLILSGGSGFIQACNGVRVHREYQRRWTVSQGGFRQISREAILHTQP